MTAEVLSGAAVERHAHFEVAEQLSEALRAVAADVGIVRDSQAVKVCRSWVFFLVLVQVLVPRLPIRQMMIAEPGMSQLLFFVQEGRPAKG